MDIAYCKIYPPIGIARVGDSEEREEHKGWFIDPASGDQLPNDFKFKDGAGRVKRQATLFHIYGFDRRGDFVAELTASKDVEIKWHVELANKKAEWFAFDGAEKALEVFENPNSKHPRRNSRVKPDDRDSLCIYGGSRKIQGKNINQGPLAPDSQSPSYSFRGFFKKKKEVYLGELKTDAEGRLIVLGGHGRSEAIDAVGKEASGMNWILNYANNDNWYDDTSDGPVEAAVLVKGKNVPVHGRAWVVVAPPDFAPDLLNVVTLFDVMEEVVYYHANLQKPAKELPPVRSPDEVYYDRDIRPILERMLGYSWVNERALRGHGTGKPGFLDLDDMGVAEKLSTPPSQLSSDKLESANTLRHAIFRVIRAPSYPLPQKQSLDKDRWKLALTQANASYMPALSGDQGNATNGDPTTWLSVTHLQYARLQKWTEGDFKTKAKKLENESLDITCRVLDRCAGGAFFPGIEMTAIARHPKLYSEPYRINDRYRAGDVTKYMALPWQADFFECNTNWWPAQRPDDVIPQAEFERTVEQFAEELVWEKKRVGNVLFNRKSWSRGIGRAARPRPEFLSTRLFPDPETLKAQDLGGYVAALCKSGGSLLALTLRDAPIETYAANTSEPFAERLPSPWRIQFLTQEQFDLMSSTYFHLTAPALEELLTPTDIIKTDLLTTSPSELKRNWSAVVMQNKGAAQKLLKLYAERVRDHVHRTLLDMVSNSKEYKDAQKRPKKDQLSSFVEASRGAGGASQAGRKHPEEIEYRSNLFYELQFYAMCDALQAKARKKHLEQVGDMEMVSAWPRHGFVRKLSRNVTYKDRPPVEIQAYVETERDEYDGLTFREYFYILMNIDEYPSFRPYAKLLAQQILDTTRIEFIEKFGVQERRGHPETFVNYSQTALRAKLEEIYEYQRKKGSDYKPWRTPGNRQEQITGLVHNAPFNQTDGAWLRGVSRAGPTDDARAMLFEIWSDEVGNGDPGLNHANLYTSLLNSVDIRLPDIASREYVESPLFAETDFISPVYELCVSLHTEQFFPELLGMTLFLEWEVLSLVPGVKLFDYLGIDSQFYRMHVGIDNATEGHGAKARRAVESYLDSIRRESGEDAVQAYWKRIWNGFVSFAAPETGYFDGDDSQPETATTQDRILALMGRKKPYGNRNHGGKKIGPHRINDLFDDPGLFVSQLAHSPWVVPGAPEQSRLITYLTTFDGPMYKIFDKNDLQLWRDWIVWLAREGDTDVPKRYLSKGESMLCLLQEVRTSAQAAQGHQLYRTRSMHGPNADRKIVELFNEPDLRDLMEELRKPENGWVIPGSADESPLMADMLRPARPMGAVLDQRFRSTGGQIGREAIMRWIDAGCPIPGRVNKFKPSVVIPTPARILLIVEKYGKGAVH